MLEITEIGESELERLIVIAAGVRPERAGTVADYAEWRRQAEDMVWLLATVEGSDAGGAIGLVGWRSSPGIAICEAFVLPEFRGRGVGSALYRELALWVAERGCIELESLISERDPDSLAWAERRGFRRVDEERANGAEGFVVVRGLLSGVD